MDDAEAEAVLLALGPQLEWEPSKQVPDVVFANVGARMEYFIKPISGQITAVHRGRRLHSNTQVIVPTLAEAKAACERHHATGEWE